jgi:hypothetical protein
MSEADERMQLQRLEWKAARKLVDASLAKQPAESFLRAADAVAGKLRSKAIVYLASYAFGEHIVDENGFRLPEADTDGRPITGVSVDSPVNLVIRNQVEVYVPGVYKLKPTKGYSNGVPIDRPHTLRLLSPGELFGTFEAVNRALGISEKRIHGMPQPSWRVAAGARSAQLICPIKSAHASAKLKLQLKAKYPHTEGPLHEWPWHLMLPMGAPLPWRVETLVFPKQWEAADLPWQWRHSVFSSAWTQVQDDKINEIRRTSLLTNLEREEELQPLLREVSNPGTAVAFLLYLDAVANGRSPAFVSSHSQRTGADAGPFADIVASLTSALGTSGLKRDTSKDVASAPIVLVPHYLRQGETGFVSFKRGPRIPEAGIIEASPSDTFARLSRGITACRKALDTLMPAIDWDSLKLVVPAPTSYLEDMCVKCSEVCMRPDLIPPKQPKGGNVDDKKPKGANADDKETPTRIDGSHPFFSACVIVSRR